MHIIKTGDSAGEPKYIVQITDGRPTWTSKKILAKTFGDEEIEQVLAQLRNDYGKTFETETA